LQRAGGGSDRRAARADQTSRVAGGRGGITGSGITGSITRRVTGSEAGRVAGGFTCGIAIGFAVTRGRGGAATGQRVVEDQRAGERSVSAGRNGDRDARLSGADAGARGAGDQAG
jgi:hypothetical protein